MRTRTLSNAYVAVLLIAGAAMLVIGSLTLDSIGGVAALAFGTSGVAAGLVLLGLRLG